jgi:hypothetical protein
MDAVAERDFESLRQVSIHAPPDDHPTIREAAKRLAGRLAKKRKPTTPTKG